MQLPVCMRPQASFALNNQFRNARTLEISEADVHQLEQSKTEEAASQYFVLV
jgi:hypothetical protein